MFVLCLHFSSYDYHFFKVSVDGQSCSRTLEIFLVCRHHKLGRVISIYLLKPCREEGNMMPGREYSVLRNASTARIVSDEVRWIYLQPLCDAKILHNNAETKSKASQVPPLSWDSNRLTSVCY